MAFATWLTSDSASWVFFGIGVLSAALAISRTAFLPAVLGRSRPLLVLRRLTKWSPAVVGPVLLLGGAVLVGARRGGLSWLSILAGAVCLFVFACLLLLEKIDEIGRRQDAAIDREEGTPLSRSRWEDDTLTDLFLESLPFGNDDTAQYLRRAADPSAQAGPDPLESFNEFAGSMERTGVWGSASVYTSDEDGAALKDAVVNVLREFGLASVVEEPPVRGSWFQRFWVRGREVAGTESVRGRLAKLEEAVQLEYLGKRRAEIDKAKAEAVATLLAAMKEQDNAVVRLGSIIVIKTQGDLVVWTIGEMEAAALEKNSELLRDPVAALKFLRGSTQAREATGLNLSPSKDALSD